MAHPRFGQHIMFEENDLMLCDNIRCAKGFLNDHYKRNPNKIVCHKLHPISYPNIKYRITRFLTLVIKLRYMICLR